MLKATRELKLPGDAKGGVVSRREEAREYLADVRWRFFLKEVTAVR